MSGKNPVKTGEDRLRDKFIKPVRKQFKLDPAFQDFTGRVKGNPDETEDKREYRRRLKEEFAKLSDYVEGGEGLPNHYYSTRVWIEGTVDELLDEHGVMHLHLGGPHSNIIVYLVQYADRVIVLEINDHKYATYSPKVSNPAGNLMAMHGAWIARNDREVEAVLSAPKPPVQPASSVQAAVEPDGRQGAAGRSEKAILDAKRAASIAKLRLSIPPKAREE